MTRPGRTTGSTGRSVSWRPRPWSSTSGSNRQVEGLAHHTLLLKKDWEKGFETLFDPAKAAWPESPSYYVNVPSKTDTTAAPPGGETLFVLVPLAPGLPDTPERRQRLRDHILTHLEATLGEPIRDAIVSERCFALDDFATRYNAYKGNGARPLAHSLPDRTLAAGAPEQEGHEPLLLGAVHPPRYRRADDPDLVADRRKGDCRRADEKTMTVIDQTVYDIFKRGSRTYFYSTLFFPPDVKAKIFSLYSFVRTADDLVDSVPQRGGEFNAFVGTYRAALDGRPAEDPVIDGFVDLQRRCGIEQAVGRCVPQLDGA